MLEALPGGRVSDELIAAVEAKLRGDEQRLTEMPTKRQIRKVLEAGRGVPDSEKTMTEYRVVNRHGWDVPWAAGHTKAVAESLVEVADRGYPDNAPHRLQTRVTKTTISEWKDVSDAC